MLTGVSPVCYTFRMDNRTYTRKAIDTLGGPSEAAKTLDVARSYIYDMLKNGAPKPRCYELSALSGVPVKKLLKEAKARRAKIKPA